MSKTDTIEASSIQSLEPVSVNINNLDHSIDTISVLFSLSSEINNITDKKTENKVKTNSKPRRPKKEKIPKEHFDHLGISNQWHLNLNLDQELNQKGLPSMGDGGIMGITQVLEENNLNLGLSKNTLKDPKKTKASLQCKLPLEGDVVSMEASRNSSGHCKD